MINETDIIRVNYHCHVSLNKISNQVKLLENENFIIDKITKDKISGYWRIDYFQLIKKYET